MREVDKELRALALEIDEDFKKIVPKLRRLGEGLVKKAWEEKGKRFMYTIGWEEGGIDTVCLQNSHWLTLERFDYFDSYEEECEWLKESVYPIFEDLDILGFDTPFGLSGRSPYADEKGGEKSEQGKADEGGVGGVGDTSHSPLGGEDKGVET